MKGTQLSNGLKPEELPGILIMIIVIVIIIIVCMPLVMGNSLPSSLTHMRVFILSQ